MCWGDDEFGALGDGTAGGIRSTPDVVRKTDGNSLTGVADIAAGSCFTCALAIEGTYCWGCNNESQLGRDVASLAQSPAALLVSASATATLVATGDEEANFSDGAMVCGWGSNTWNALMSGNRKSSDTPSCFGLPSVVQTTLGRGWGCARLASGSVQCWGLILGTDSMIVQPPATYMPSVTATDLGGGMGHACARVADSTVKCWGANGEGELGDGTSQSETVPTNVLDQEGIPLSNVLANGLSKSGTALHNCAILGDGSLRCWGWNGNGQVGNGSPATNVTSATPVKW